VTFRFIHILTHSLRPPALPPSVSPRRSGSLCNFCLNRDSFYARPGSADPSFNVGFHRTFFMRSPFYFFMAHFSSSPPSVEGLYVVSIYMGYEWTTYIHAPQYSPVLTLLKFPPPPISLLVVLDAFKGNLLFLAFVQLAILPTSELFRPTNPCHYRPLFLL